MTENERQSQEVERDNWPYHCGECGNECYVAIDHEMDCSEGQRVAQSALEYLRSLQGTPWALPKTDARMENLRAFLNGTYNGNRQ